MIIIYSCSRFLSLWLITLNTVCSLLYYFPSLDTNKRALVCTRDVVQSPGGAVAVLAEVHPDTGVVLQRLAPTPELTDRLSIRPLIGGCRHTVGVYKGVFCGTTKINYCELTQRASVELRKCINIIYFLKRNKFQNLR